MERGRGRQGDLFNETPQTVELRLELRCKIAQLLQTLLTEAAGVTTAADRIGSSRRRGGW